MKNTYFLPTLLGLFSLSFQVSALTTADAPIQQVTLYPGAAKIERSIKVKSGEQLVSLQGLAANFDINQLQYQTSGIDVNAVSHTDSALDKPAGNESSQLKTEIEQVRDQISAQNAIIQSAELQNKFLTNITKGSARKVQKQAYQAFIAIDEAKIKKEKLTQRLNELEQDLNAIGDHGFNQRTLKFHVNAPQNGEIHISYMIPYARWQPVYKAELDSKTQQLKLSRMAMIAQKTGEDWNNVKLTLSTSTPQNYVEQISPAPWWVNYYEPEPIRPMPAPVAMAEMAYGRASAKMQAAGRDNPEPGFPQFEASEQNFSTEFRSSTKASVPSSQQLIYLPLSTEQYPAKLSVWAIPKQSTQATVNVEIPAQGNNWPSGMVRLYRDGDYIGQRNWNNHADSSLQMSFGVDDQIQIQVTDLSNKKSPAGKTQSTTVQKQQYTVKNLHRYPVNLVLFESSPQSQNGKLNTQSTYSLPPSQTSWNGQPGINSWQTVLQPAQSFQLDVQHEFNFPAKGTTSGF